MQVSMLLSVIGALCFSLSSFANAQTIAARGGYSYFQSLTGDASNSTKSRWDNLYRKHKGYVFGKEPAAFLVENMSSLPKFGKALDIAMGEGRNAVFLAKKGFEVDGVEISEVAIRKARQLANENKVRIHAINADLNKYQIAPQAYNLIIVFYYLQRSLAPQIVKGLKPGGILVFETNTIDHLKYDRTYNREYLLQKDELKTLFKELEVLKYEERDDGVGVVASLIARKR
ncbi:MAG: methyltransferase domain-containing protein [Bdellovibrionota bacterium]